MCGHSVLVKINRSQTLTNPGRSRRVGKGAYRPRRAAAAGNHHAGSAIFLSFGISLTIKVVVILGVSQTADRLGSFIPFCATAPVNILSSRTADILRSFALPVTPRRLLPALAIIMATACPVFARSAIPLIATPVAGIGKACVTFIIITIPVTTFIWCHLTAGTAAAILRRNRLGSPQKNCGKQHGKK